MKINVNGMTISIEDFDPYSDDRSQESIGGLAIGFTVVIGLMVAMLVGNGIVYLKDILKVKKILKNIDRSVLKDISKYIQDSFIKANTEIDKMYKNYKTIFEKIIESGYTDKDDVTFEDYFDPNANIDELRIKLDPNDKSIINRVTSHLKKGHDTYFIKPGKTLCGYSSLKEFNSEAAAKRENRKLDAILAQFKKTSGCVNTVLYRDENPDDLFGGDICICGSEINLKDQTLLNKMKPIIDEIKKIK